MSHQFKISVEAADRIDVAPLTFEVESHDDLLAIVERVRRMNIVSAREAPALAIGLKLFSEVIIQHRDEPLFAELSAALPAFMKRLKAHESPS